MTNKVRPQNIDCMKISQEMILNFGFSCIYFKVFQFFIDNYAFQPFADLQGVAMMSQQEGTGRRKIKSRRLKGEIIHLFSLQNNALLHIDNHPVKYGKSKAKKIVCSHKLKKRRRVSRSFIFLF